MGATVAFQSKRRLELGPPVFQLNGFGAGLCTVEAGQKGDINHLKAGFSTAEPAAVLRYLRPPSTCRFIPPMPVSLLVLTDFSPAAYRALNYANSLAGPIGAQLVLLHVRRDSLLDPGAFSGLRDAGSAQALDLAMAALVSNMSAPVVTEIGHGQVADVVAETLRRYPSAVVVVGRPDKQAIP